MNDTEARRLAAIMAESPDLLARIEAVQSLRALNLGIKLSRWQRWKMRRRLRQILAAHRRAEELQKAI